MSEIIQCDFCGTKYNQEYRLRAHLKNRTSKCKEMESFFESKIQQRLATERKLLKKKVQTRLSMKNNELRTLKMEYAELKHENSELRSKLDKPRYLTTNQEKKSLSLDTGKFPPIPQGLCVVHVGNEDYDDFLQMDDVRENLGLGPSGDIELFRKIYIDEVEPANQSIRLKDFARKKFIAYDGNEWKICHLCHILNIFIPKIRAMYDRVITKKNDYRKKIIAKYQNDKEQLNVEILLFDERYKDKTTHWGKLNVRDQQHIRKVGVGIVDLFSRYERKDYDKKPNND